MNAPLRAVAPARLYGTLALDRPRRRWVLDTGEPHVAIRLKSNFPKIPKGSSTPFDLPHDDVHSAELAWFMGLYPMRMSAADRRELEEGGDRRRDEVAEAGRITSPEWRPSAPIQTRPGTAIRTYQEQAVALVALTRSLLLGDDVGLGKTYAAIGLALRGDTLPMALVVLGNLQAQWVAKFAEMCDLECHVVTTTRAYELPDVPVVVFRYSNVRGWADVFATGRFRTAVWDEVHELRTGAGTDKGRACMALARNTHYQLGLSATPIFNYGAEIYEVLRFLPGGRPGHVLGRHDDFLREWCAGSKLVRDPEALGSHLRDANVMLRRTKGDVGQEMDRVTTIVVDVPYDEAEERRVEDLARELALRSLTGAYVERGRSARELDLLLREVTGASKARGVARFVRMLLESGDPARRVLVSGWHRRFYDVVRRELADVPTCMYTGSETVAAKRRSLAAFASGEARVMLISNRSGAGLDGIQTHCSDLVVGELDWSGEVHKQLVGRLDREGQTLPVSAYYAITDGGSDPSMVEVLGLKASQAQGIVDLGRLPRSTQTDEGRLGRLARDWLARRGVEWEAPADADPGPAVHD